MRRGAERASVMEAIRPLLPAGVHVAALETLEQASGYPSRAYRVNLNVLAMVALFTGGFLVFSAQALETARRRGEHALLRVLGLTARGLARLCLLEAGAHRRGRRAARRGAGLRPRASRAALRRRRSRRRTISRHRAAACVPWRLRVLLLSRGHPRRRRQAGFCPRSMRRARPPARALRAGDEQRMFQRAGARLARHRADRDRSGAVAARAGERAAALRLRGDRLPARRRDRR